MPSIDVIPNATDITLFCLLLFFLLDGWRKGFIKSVIGPITFIFSSIVGIVYFDVSQNFIKAFFIAAFATMILSFILLTLLMLGKRSVDPLYRDYSPLLGRFMGSAINVLWQGAILLIIGFLITIAPFQVYGFHKIQNNIQQSSCYALIKQRLNQLPPFEKMITAFSIFQNPDQMQRLSSTKEFQIFFSNSKVQSLLQDEKFMENVRAKNIPKMMNNPKIWEILNDDSLMEDFGQLAEKVYSLNLSQEGQETQKVDQ